ncbi:MAG: DUF5681 domain-containing protein [Rhizomicrobium sp.]
MSDEIGFRKPPVKTRFQPGVSGNRSGRPKRKQSDLAKCVTNVLNAPMEFVEGGRKKIATREEVKLRLLIAKAVKGDVKAAEDILYVYGRAQSRREGGMQRIVVTDWLEDFDGQTAEDKERVAQGDHGPEIDPCAAHRPPRS